MVICNVLVSLERLELFEFGIGTRLILIYREYLHVNEGTFIIQHILFKNQNMYRALYSICQKKRDMTLG